MLYHLEKCTMTKKKKSKKKKKPLVHKDLKGFDIQLNPFGEVISNIKVEELNEFLNEHVDDKKLRTKKSDEEE